MPLMYCKCGRPAYQEPKVKTPECSVCRDERENELRREMRRNAIPIDQQIRGAAPPGTFLRP